MRGNRTVPCESCGELFTSWAYERRRYCSRSCAQAVMRRSRYPLLERLTGNITIVDDHWIWRGQPTKNGYGRLSVENRVIYAHQAAWIAVAGPIPPGAFVCHTCDIPLCVRNDDEGTYEVGGITLPRRGHLWLGTVADNQRDMALKGRGRNAGYLGSSHPNALLSAENVRELRALWATGQWTQVALGKRYGVTNHAIWRVLHGDNWAHVE